jgi:hypothetical protein
MEGPKWQFNLDKASQKTNEVALKEPNGFKCSTTDVVVRSNTSKSSNMTYVEVLEAKAWAFAKSPSGQIF